MHHAKKAEASGFCYVNDIVMAILELLKVIITNVVTIVRLRLGLGLVVGSPRVRAAAGRKGAW